MNKAALLVIAVQEALVAAQPYREGEFLALLRRLIARSRERGAEVVFVRHDDGEGSELEAGSPGWQVCAALSPADGEKIVDTRFNSAFVGTGLDDYLRARGVRRLILAGMQTEYCIDATCKAAFERGYAVVIPEGATTTFDNGPLPADVLCEFYERRIWDGRFAQVLPIEQTEELLG